MYSLGSAAAAASSYVGFLPITPSPVAATMPGAAPASSQQDSKQKKTVSLIATELEQRIEQRTKQLIYGKVTIAYSNLQALIAQKFDVDRPATPRIDLSKTKRQFDVIVRAWRRELHRFDDQTPSDSDFDTASSEVTHQEEWVTPVLQATFDRLAYHYPKVKEPKELIEGDHKAPAPRVLELIDSYFFKQRIDQDPRYLEKLTDSADHLVFDVKKLFPGAENDLTTDNPSPQAKYSVQIGRYSLDHTSALRTDDVSR